MLLIPYVKLSGDKYVLDISEEEAVKLGVTANAYRYQSEMIEIANAMIEQIKANGDSIDLIDVASEFEAAKKSGRLLHGVKD